MTIEEEIDDLFYENGIEVMEFPDFDKVESVSVRDGEDRVVALNPRLCPDRRAVAKMHEWEHHKLNLFYGIEQKRNVGRMEERVRREVIYDFLPEEKLRHLILLNGTFDPDILAEDSHFSAKEIEYAEFLYYYTKGITAPRVG